MSRTRKPVPIPARITTPAKKRRLGVGVMRQGKKAIKRGRVLGAKKMEDEE